MGFLIQEDSNPIFGLIAADFLLEAGGTTIQIRDFATQAVIAVQPANTLEAFVNGADIGIRLLGGGTIIIDALVLSTISINTIQVTQVQATAINELDALFANVGAAGVAPTVTGGAVQTVNSLVGATINYLVSGTNIVAINWDFSLLPVGHDIAVINSGNHSSILGSADVTKFPVGTYVITFTCINYFGSVTTQINLVKGVAFVNTYSLYPGNTIILLRPTDTARDDESPLYRAANGTGASDAWTMTAWIKGLYNFNTHQSICAHGKASYAGGVAGGDVTFIANSNTILFHYGGTPTANSLNCTATLGTTDANWHLITVTYDGGTTGNTAADINLYYSRFRFYIDGVEITGSGLVWTNYNYGHTGKISSNSNYGNGYRVVFRRHGVDEFALWETELTPTQITALYNLGVPLDLITSTGLGIPVPYNYLRMGDGTSGGLTDITGFPNVYDMGTSGNDMTLLLANIGMYINDTP